MADEVAPSTSQSQLVRRRLLDQVARLFLAISLLVQVAGCLAFWNVWRTARLEERRGEVRVVITSPETPTAEARGIRPTPTPATPTPAPTPTPSVPRVGFIAGHWQNDSGAVCEDTGLQEVDVTLDVTRRAVRLLRERGYWVDMFPEFAPELYGYRADAFLSVHADSCVDWEGTTGFKAARAVNSAIPEVEDQFLACLYDRYAAVTGLTPHDGSITHNMRGYHAFYKVDPSTPALIVEIGFLYHDREVLTERPERIARGLAESVECFLATQGRALP